MTSEHLNAMTIATALDSHRRYWRERLAGDIPRTAIIRDYGSPEPYKITSSRIPIRMPERIIQKFQYLALSPGNLDFCFLLANVNLLLSRYTRSEEVIVGCPKIDRRGEMIPIRSRLSPTQPFGEYLTLLGNQLQRDYEHQDFGYFDLIEALGLSFSEHQNPLFSIGFCFENLHGSISLIESHCEILFRFNVDEGRLEGTLEFNNELYREDHLVSMPAHLINVLDSVAETPGISLGSVHLMGNVEKEKILKKFNDNEQAFPLHKTIPELFQEQVSQRPQAIAVIYRDEQLTYKMLNERANRLAHILRRKDVVPGRYVAILEYRSINFLVAMLAIWKAGGAYIPIDPNYPEKRVSYMLINSEASLLISRLPLLKKTADSLLKWPHLKTVILLDAGDSRDVFISNLSSDLEILSTDTEHGQSPANIELTAGPRDPAYMIYTSGSTGRPKGAIVRFDGAVNHIFAQFHFLEVEHEFRFLQSAPSSSDISVWQFVAPLLAGDATVIVDDVSDIEYVFHLIKNYQVNIIEFVPVILKYFVEYARELPVTKRAMPALRWMMVTGEAAPVRLVNDWLRAYPSIPVLNSYGPTETADDITQACIEKTLPDNLLSVPIGKPLANLDIYILDHDMEPVPVCVPGEICVAGVGVGAGYWNNEEKTRTSFVKNSFPKAKGKVIYKTGDLGRWLPGGILEYLGRMDEQVQIRGFRIELGEIEHLLCQHPDIKGGIVNFFSQGDGDGLLVAYVIPRDGHCLISQNIIGFLAGKLAEHMIPSVIVTLKKIPLTPAGKIDRKNLPVPTKIASAQKRLSPSPRNDIEATLIDIVESVLKMNGIGIDDNLFDLGADSIHIVQTVAFARNAGIRICPPQVFSNPTVSMLASSIESRSSTTLENASGLSKERLSPIRSVSREEVLRVRAHYQDAEDVYPLSPIQEGIFFHCLLSRSKEIYFDQFCYELDGKLNVRAFKEAWQQVIDANPILRSVFDYRRLKRPVQVVLTGVEIAFEYQDWRGEPDEKKRLADYLQKERLRGLKLSEAPLMRIAVLCLSNEKYRLVWNHHHILLDGWSLDLVLKQVVDRYEILSGQIPGDQAPARFYNEYVDWLQQQDTTVGEPFWKRAMRGLTPSQENSTWKTKKPTKGYFEKNLTLSQKDTNRLELYARDNGLTTSTLLQGVWALTFARISNQRDIVFGSVVSGREADFVGIESIVGLFINTLPVRVKIEESGTIISWLKNIQNYLVEMRSWEWIPPAKIRAWSEQAANSEALFESIFVFSNYPHETQILNQGDRLSIRLGEFHTIPDYPISVIVMPENRLLLRIVCDAEDVDAEIAQNIIDTYQSFLFEILRSPDSTPVCMLDKVLELQKEQDV